jgi:hypothetical protein
MASSNTISHPTQVRSQFSHAQVPQCTALARARFGLFLVFTPVIAQSDGFYLYHFACPETIERGGAICPKDHDLAACWVGVEVTGIQRWGGSPTSK